jgi:hypothetical protein
MKLKDLKVGEIFDAGIANLKVLEHFNDGTTLVVTAETIGDRPFNLFPFKYARFEGFKLNDWRTSTIRKDLNENFLAAIKAAGKIDTDKIIPAVWDLSDHLGGVGYGTSRDKIGLLSQKQFEKYAEQDLLELDDWWWLITPYAGYSHLARRVYSNGSLCNGSAYYGLIGVRPAFYLKSDEETQSNPLANFTTQELLSEISQRIKGEETK